MVRKPPTYRPNRLEENRRPQPKEEEAGAQSTKGRMKQRASRPKEEESRGEDEESRRLMNRIKQSL